MTIASQTVMSGKDSRRFHGVIGEAVFAEIGARFRHRRRVRETARRIRDGKVCCQFSNSGFGRTDEFRAKPIDCKPSRFEWTAENSYS